MAKNIIHISTPQRTYYNGVWRVSAVVAGEPLWFESNGAEIIPSAEAFLTAFFIPALHTKSKLTIDAALNPAGLKTQSSSYPFITAGGSIPQSTR
jgi:hypothetical protein